MEVIKIVVVYIVLITTCFSMENKTANHCSALNELEQQLKVQKREKQYLIEDDPSERPEQRRDGRQSNPEKNNRIESNVNPKTIKVRLQPKPVSTPTKQSLKPAGIIKPISIDTKPQRIPTKIPVILKTAKVVPGPAHARRLKIIENENKNSLQNKEEAKGQALSPNTVEPGCKDNIPFILDYKKSPTAERRSSPSNVDEIISNHDNNATLYTEGKEISEQDKKVTGNKNSLDTLNEDGDEEKVLNQDQKTLNINRQPSETVQKPVHFFVDEPEHLPPTNKKQHKSQNTNTKNREVLSTKMKDSPIINIINNKPKKDESRQKDLETDDQTEDDSNITRISNGTHLISIKKIQNPDTYQNQRSMSRDASENTPETDSRIINLKIINLKPPKPSPTTDEKPENNPDGGTDKGKNVGLPGIVFRERNNEEKDLNDCITITNHNYEEIEEKAPIPPPITIQPDVSQGSWNYLQNPQDSYYIPNYPNIYDQYRRNYGVAQSTPNMYGQENVDRYAPNPENAQIIYPDADVSSYNDANQYQYPNYPYAYEKQPEIDYTFCPQHSPENNLDRIWRAWKDVEIKIRNSQPTDEPINIDIRRDMGENKGDKAVGKAKLFATSPINLNGYLNNQNSAFFYPNYRYMH